MYGSYCAKEDQHNIWSTHFVVRSTGSDVKAIYAHKNVRAN